MTLPTLPNDAEWGKLAGLAEAEREPQMLRRFKELGGLPEPELQKRLLAMSHTEYALPADGLRTVTLSRMRVFLKLEAEAGKRMAGAYNAVMVQMPGSAAMRRVALVQSLAQEFSEADANKLRALNPDIFGASPAGLAFSAKAAAKAAPVMAPVAAKKAGWWPFGKK